MPQLYFRSVAPGTQSTNPTIKSDVGHAWIEIHHDNGQVESFGFYPEFTAPGAPGEINPYGKDSDLYPAGWQGTAVSPAFQISDSQAQAIRDFQAQVDQTGTWIVLPGVFSHFAGEFNCASWALEAFRVARACQKFCV